MIATRSMEPKLHVSRWRLGAARGSGAPGGAGQSHTSLRYLNEFVGQLQCAPALLQHGLFPDAKEVTESMGLFNAVRRYVLPASDAVGRAEGSEKPDGIVVVGDGNTPRSAAMLAFRLRNWKCFSIDPAMEMQSSERSRGWGAIGNLVVIRNKIENVRISLRRAVVVLVHAHVTLEQALGAVDAEDIAGVVTLPCCNWYSRQEELFGRQPDLVYDDFSILSDHREIRLWAGEKRSEAVRVDHSDFSAKVKPLEMMKGCIRKEFVADARETANPLPTPSPKADIQTTKRKTTTNPAAFFRDIMHDSTSSDGETCKESLSEAVYNAVISHVPKHAGILVLVTQGSNAWTKSMLLDGYNNLYCATLASSDGGAADNGLQLDLDKQFVSGPDSSMKGKRVGTIYVKAVIPSDGSCQIDSHCSLVADNSNLRQVGITHIVDAGFLYRGFRSQPKNSQLLRNTCQLLEKIATATHSPEERIQASDISIISVTGTKSWRKKDSLAHPTLGYQISTAVVKDSVSDEGNTKPTFVFCCRKRNHHQDSESSSPAGQDHGNLAARDQALALQRLLAKDFSNATQHLKTSGELGDDVFGASTVASKISSESEEGEHFVASGRIARIRRFSHGMAFISLVDESAAMGGKQSHSEGLQVFLREETLRESSPSVPFADLVPLFRKGDTIKVVGQANRNDRGREMLVALAVRPGPGGEFEEF